MLFILFFLEIWKLFQTKYEMCKQTMAKIEEKLIFQIVEEDLSKGTIKKKT